MCSWRRPLSKAVTSLSQLHIFLASLQILSWDSSLMCRQSSGSLALTVAWDLPLPVLAAPSWKSLPGCPQILLTHCMYHFRTLEDVLQDSLSHLQESPGGLLASVCALDIFAWWLKNNWNSESFNLASVVALSFGAELWILVLVCTADTVFNQSHLKLVVICESKTSS